MYVWFTAYCVYAVFPDAGHAPTAAVRPASPLSTTTDVPDSSPVNVLALLHVAVSSLHAPVARCASSWTSES
ncbi:hypothetical protein, partial [Streptomyces sp. c-19]|uniref:hypothetical protein n=1 Tax=Streptomyces sp. c-19 TaxID=2789275 RepID=UPI00397EF0AD